MPTRPFELPDPPASRDDDAGPGPIELLRFARKAVRRRAGVALVVLLAGLSAVAGYLALATPRYRAETRVLAQPQQAFASIARASGIDEHPTYAAWELIHRRESLVQLVARAGLLEKPPTPGLLDRAWDQLLRVTVGGVPDDPLEQLVRVLDRELKVETGDATITIRLDWSNPQQGYQIVDGALQTFLDARRAQEVTSLDEAIAILRGRAGRLRGELTLAMDETREAFARAARKTPRRSPPTEAAPGTQRPGDDEELAGVKSALDAKRRAIADVEEYRRRRLAELAAQYDSKRALYTDDHPDMVTLRADIAALGRDTRQLASLRAEARQLQGAYDDLVARQPPRREVAPPPDDTTVAPSEPAPTAIEQSDRVREARRRYEDVLQSLNQAQVELDTARSAFAHRYQVVWPAEVTRRPVSPKVPLVLGLGIVASIAVALLAAVLVEWRSGTLVEPWQIETGLGLPLLGEVRRAR